MIKLLKFVGVPTSDQDRALAFWTEKVGFRVATDQPMGAQRWIELSIPGADTGVVLFTPEGHEDRIGTFFNGSKTSITLSPSSRIQTATPSCWPAASEQTRRRRPQTDCPPNL